MKEIPFEDGGALLADSPVYVESNAERPAIRHLLRMDYITLVEPRQQGKTSLINRLSGQLVSHGFVFAYTDLTTLDKTDEQAWYDSLGDWILRQLRFVRTADHPKMPENGNSWRNFLYELSETAEKDGLNIVLALDEVGALPKMWATDFFSAIRSIYNSRQTMSCFRYLTFIVAGAFNPKDLIRDPSISNFNVDHRLHINDFSLEQIGGLTRHLELGDKWHGVTERIHYWTSGQPFICQRLCRNLAEQEASIVPDSVDVAVDRFLREDTNHLAHILSELRKDPDLLDYAQDLVAKRTKFSPGLNDWQFRLAHEIGIIAMDQDGLCRIRNHIYEQALRLGELGTTFTREALDSGDSLLGIQQGRSSVHHEVEKRVPTETLLQKTLTGSQVKQIQVAIMAGYDPDSLRSMVRIYLDRNLHEIVSGDNFDRQVVTLIEWFERRGQMLDLVRAAHEANRGNAALQTLWNDIQTWQI